MKDLFDVFFLTLYRKLISAQNRRTPFKAGFRSSTSFIIGVFCTCNIQWLILGTKADLCSRFSYSFLPECVMINTTAFLTKTAHHMILCSINRYPVNLAVFVSGMRRPAVHSHDSLWFKHGEPYCFGYRVICFRQLPLLRSPSLIWHCCRGRGGRAEMVMPNLMSLVWISLKVVK